MEEQWASGRFVADSRGGEMTVIGVAARQVRWDDEISPAEIAAAKTDAALKIAMFYGVRGTVESFHRTGAGFFDFIAESQIHLEPAVADPARFVERLTFDMERDVLLFSGGMDSGTMVRFRYAAGAAPVAFAGAIGPDGRPDWIGGGRLPEIDGYVAAVGFSQNQIRLRDTVMRATQAAAARMIKAMSTTVQTIDVDVVGQGSVTYIRSRSEGALSHFRVIEFWIEPASMSVYALGIARLAQ